jgi:hypothetical protein
LSSSHHCVTCENRSYSSWPRTRTAGAESAAAGDTSVPQWPTHGSSICLLWKVPALLRETEYSSLIRTRSSWSSHRLTASGLGQQRRIGDQRTWLLFSPILRPSALPRRARAPVGETEPCWSRTPGQAGSSLEKPLPPLSPVTATPTPMAPCAN